MISLEKRILNKLLDSYERSKLSRGENIVAVHITYAFQKDNIPEYFDESSLAYEDIHSMLLHLQEKGFITIDWKDKKAGHIVKGVTLCEEAIPNVYQYLHRIPKTDMENVSLEMFDRMIKGKLSPIAMAFVERMSRRVKNGQSIKEYMDISKPEQMEEFIYALYQTEKNKKECFVREFSIRIFHDSKKYEQLISKICKVIAEERIEFDGMEKEEILSEYQIYHNPSYVYMKGNIELELNRKTIDVGMFSEGLGYSVNESNLKELHLKYSGVLENVYTIENLTSFFRFEKEKSLIIYLGGYHNHVRRVLLEKICEIFPNANYYHFGDIDAGGFQIFYHLKEKTGIPFKMYRMNLETLMQYEEYGKKLTENDRSRLKKIQNEYEDNEMKICIDYMLKHNVKLEQEIVSFDLSNV